MLPTLCASTASQLAPHILQVSASLLQLLDILGGCVGILAAVLLHNLQQGGLNITSHIASIPTNANRN